MRTFTEDFDVGADPFLTPDEFLAHPQMVDNERVVVLSDAEVGPCVQVGPLAHLSATPARITALLAELGYSPDATDRLVADGVAGVWHPPDGSGPPLPEGRRPSPGRSQGENDPWPTRSAPRSAPPATG